MAKDRRARIKGRKGKAGFMGLPHHVLNSTAYRDLGGWPVKLLVDITSQYNGFNNGDLTAAWTIMQPKGWRSRDTLNKARKKLLEHGLIQVTRQGGRHKPTLYAVTWQNINECKGKLETSPTDRPSNRWKEYE